MRRRRTKVCPGGRPQVPAGPPTPSALAVGVKQRRGAAEDHEVSSAHRPPPMRCPSCGAANRGDAAWCTQCHTTFGPPPTPVQARATPAPGRREEMPSEAGAPAARGARHASGRHSARGRARTVPDLGGAMAAALAEQSGEDHATVAPVDPVPVGTPTADPEASGGGVATLRSAELPIPPEELDAMLLQLRAQVHDPRLDRLRGMSTAQRVYVGLAVFVATAAVTAGLTALVAFLLS